MPPRRISLSEVGRQNINYSDAERIIINNALKVTKAGLLRLGTLRNKVGADRRRQLKDQIYRCKVALAPYKNVPKETWMYIFELYCQFAPQLSTCDKRKQPPVVLSQVCSAWRQIVLSMPKLWSDVHLDQDVDLARIWLERAGNIPRSLETSAPKSPSHCFRFQKIQSFLYSFHFRKLHITQCDATRIDFRAIPVKSLLPLEDLALIKPAWDAPDLGVTYLAPHHFPNLVSLQIDTIDMPCFHAYHPFTTWKKLRVLRLKCELQKVKCREILCDASSVEDCSLRISRLSYYNQDSTENTVVANLKTLRLSFPSTLSLWSFLGHFIFPNLDTLILIPQHSITLMFYPFDGLTLLRLAPRIGQLRSLKIGHSFRRFDVALVLECLPLLQALELDCAKITTQIAEKIGRGELGGHLREFCDWSFNNLYEFLQACELRRDVTQGQSQNCSGTIARLEKVSVMHTRSATDCKQRIRKLRKGGIEFKVTQKIPNGTGSGWT